MTAFILLVSVGVAYLLTRVLGRVIYVVPPLAVFLTSLLGSSLFLVLYGALRSPIPVSDPATAMLPDAAYSVVVAILVGTVAVAFRQRAAERERVAW
jgi:hypothetical protein